MTDIDNEDLCITPWPDYSKGGQLVGTANGVRVEHAETGVVAIVNVYRSRHKNLKIAKDMILAALTHPEF